jgi:hypothetical protein
MLWTDWTNIHHLTLAIAVTCVSLSLYGCSDGSKGGADAQRPTPSLPGGIDLRLRAIPSLKFDTDELVVPANLRLQLLFINTDLGVDHNLSVYSEMAIKPIVTSTYCRADCERRLVLELDPGAYQFRCDVHPAMKGVLTAIDIGG